MASKPIDIRWIRIGSQPPDIRHLGAKQTGFNLMIVLYILYPRKSVYNTMREITRYSNMASNPINIQWIKTKSQPQWKIMYSIFYSQFSTNMKISDKIKTSFVSPGLLFKLSTNYTCSLHFTGGLQERRNQGMEVWLQQVASRLGDLHNGGYGNCLHLSHIWYKSLDRKLINPGREGTLDCKYTGTQSFINTGQKF